MITITLSVMAMMMMKLKNHVNHDNFYDNSTDDDDNVSIQVDCLAKHLLRDASISNPFDI